ncbi:MAG: NAD(P)H-binding protein [Candidatus Promineifilaceae bacterium]
MILVTGGTGFVGRSLIQALIDGGRQYKTLQCRLDNVTGLRGELIGVDTVIHLASAESRNRLKLLEHVDILGTKLLLEACAEAGVEHFITLSRLNADPNSLYALLKAKGRAERHIRESGMEYTILRSATLFGRHDRFLNVIAGMAAWSWPFVWLPGKGLTAMQPMWVEDACRCIIQCLDRPELNNKTLEIAGAERLRYAEIAKLVINTSNLRRITFSPSVKIVRPLALLLFGWWRHPPITRYVLDRFTTPEVAPLDSVLRHFDFQPARLDQRISYLRRRHPGLHLFRLG